MRTPMPMPALNTPALDQSFLAWHADTVAEAVPGIQDATSQALWSAMAQQGDDILENIWHLLTEPQRDEINSALVALKIEWSQWSHDAQ